MTTSNNQALLGQAISSLRLQDITLHGARFRRPATPEANGTVRAVEQGKRVVQYVITEEEKDGSKKRSVNVLIELGLRIVGSEDEKDPPIFFEIEADFVAEYELKNEVSDAAIKVFAEYNAVHNVWPFWRQHVFDIVQRARLPHIQVPLFAGNPTTSVVANSAEP